MKLSMSLREAFVIWTCLLVIVATEASSDAEEAFLIYSSGSAIRKVSLVSHKDEPFVADPLHRYVAVAVSANPDNVYWSTINVDEKTITRSLNNISVPEVIVNEGLVAPEKLAVDWVTGNVYFIDAYKKHIGVCTKNGLHCTVILNLTTNAPGGLVLNPKEGEMFWSDYGPNPSIWRAHMDGSEARAIVTEYLDGPKDLAINYTNESLCWVNSKSMIVESVRFNGTNRQTLGKLKGNQIHSIAIYDDEIYWSDWKTKTIKSTKIANGFDPQIIANATGLIYDLDIYHSSLKPKLPNPCNNRNRCSEICLLAGPHKFSCACKLGSKMESNTCNPINKPQHLVIAAGDKILHYHEKIIGKALIEETPTPINMSRIVYDPNTGNLIADDRFTNSLFNLNPVNNEALRITPINVKNLGGIDVDYKKNIIRWSVTNPRRISQMESNNAKATVSKFENFSFPDVPLEILSIPERDKSFVVFKSNDERLSLKYLDVENSSTKEMIESNLIGPKISLAHDQRRERLYFADEGTGKIQYVSNDINAKYVQRQLFHSGPEKPVSLAVLNNKVFWTARDSNVLQWVDIDDEYHEIKSTILPIENSVGIMDIVTVETVTA